MRTRLRAPVLFAVRLTLLGWFVAFAAAEARAQNWTFRPVFTLAAGYDSNIVFTPGASPGDYFGSLGVLAPLSGRLGMHSMLTARYSATGEWYRDLSVFDAFPSEQSGSVAWNYASGEAWHLALSASYSESRRPEDVFPEAGTGYLRGRTRNLGAGATFSHRLGQRSTADLGYTYGRPIYEPLDLDDRQRRAESHQARAGLQRQLSRSSSISLRYTYQLYLRTGEEDDKSQVAGLGYDVGWGPNTKIALFAGARFQAGQVRPETSALLTRAWRTSQLVLGYSRSRNYVPTTEGFTETDSTRLSYSLGRRRFQLSLAASYSRNRLEAGDGIGRAFGAWRGSANTVYRLVHWLGLGANYQYTRQDSGEARFDDRTRHVAEVGMVVQPWTDRGTPEGLR